MTTEDQVTSKFDMKLIRAITPKGAPVITVYEHPADYPDKYVARLYNGRMPTYLIATADTLEEIRLAKPQEMIRISRMETDPPKIMETWL